MNLVEANPKALSPADAQSSGNSPHKEGRCLVIPSAISPYKIFVCRACFLTLPPHASNHAGSQALSPNFPTVFVDNFPWSRPKSFNSGRWP